MRLHALLLATAALIAGAILSPGRPISAADVVPATAPAPSELRAKFGANLGIVTATYGGPGKFIDVTSKLQSLIKDNMLFAQVGKDLENPGGDGPKVVGITYWDGSAIKTASAKDSDYLRLMSASKLNQPLPWLEKLVPNNGTSADKSADGLKVSSKEKKGLALIQTDDPVKTPLVITAIARTDSNNIRLFFGDRGMVILNWEANNDELRHHDPKSGEQSGVPGKGAVRKNAFANIRWSIDANQSRVEVDGAERASFRGDYSGLVGKLGIGTTEGSILTVKSFQVTFLPERPSAAAVSLAGLPTMKEITDLVDSAKYQQALAPLNRLIELKGPAAVSFDRHQLLMLRAECLFQLKQTQSCMQTLATAAKDAPSPQKAYEAIAFADLIQKSPRGTYTSDRDTKGAWYEMTDRTKRKEAYKALWEDELANITALMTKAQESAAVPPIMDAARPLVTARAAEYVATGKTETCDKLSNQLRDRAVTIVEGLLNNLSRQTDNLTNTANSKIITHFTDGTTVERRIGLTQAQVDELKGVEANCKQAIGVLQELVQIFPDVQTFKDLGNKAIAIGKKSENTRTTLY